MAEYETDTYEWHECRVIERNGLLRYVEDLETGERKYVDVYRVRGDRRDKR